MGGELTPYQTGYGSVIASRVPPFFVFRAASDGIVTKVTDSIITVEYSDGNKEGYQLGIKHGKDGGNIIPHKYTTDMSKGDTFKKGYVLAWNHYFFRRDFFSRYNVTYTGGCLATMALKEGNDTLEDGSAISERLSKKLTSYISKATGIVVDFDQEISDLVKVGDKVEYNTPLCTISETLTEGMDLTDEALVGLSKLANKNPKAKVEGTVSKIEIFYMGDVETATSSLQVAIMEDNKRRAKLVKELGGDNTGKVGAVRKPAFIAGEKLTHNKAIVVVHMDIVLPSEVGDKSSVANQLKTVHGRVMEGVNRTESGIELDLLFGAQATAARIVYSAYIQGTMNRVLTKISKDLATEYKNS